MEQYRCSWWVGPSVSGELSGDESVNVFEEDPIRASGLNSSLDKGEEVTGVLIGCPFACVTERLARETSR
jgi:hypothetical protein